MTPEQSLAKVKEVAKAFVLRFQKETPTGYDRAKAKLDAFFTDPKEALITKLNHPQRIAYIAALEHEMALADKKVAA